MKFKNIISKKGITSLKKITLAFISGFIISTAVAQTNVQIGSSTNNSGVVPIRTDLQYSYSQQIYTATELINAGAYGPVDITKLRFYLTTNNTSNSTDWTIYMGNTTKTVFSTNSDWEPISNLSTHYSGSVTPQSSGSWMEIVLDTPFQWNGVDNIIIAIDQNQSGSSTSNSAWEITSKGENRAIYYFGNTNIDPAVPLTASGIFDKVNNIQFELANNFSQNAQNALNFNASNGYCSANLPTVFDNIATNDFTVECWVKPESSSISKRIFFAQKDQNNFSTVLINGVNVSYFFIRKNGIYYSLNTQTTLSTSQWSHIAFTWDASTNTMKGYINGNEISGVSGGSSTLGNDGIMTIGARTDGDQIFKGSIDEFRVWDDIRTPCEILAGMNSEFTSVQPNLVASYNFNQGIANGSNAGVTTLPELNNNYNATLNGFLLNGSSSNWVTSGASIIIGNNNSTTHYLNDVVDACVNYTWTDGNNYTSSNNTATHTYTSPAGCTVIERLNLTINQPTTGIDIQTACESYTWIDNVTYTSSNNTATHTIVGGNANGCDSIVTLNLTINQPTTGIDVQTACGSYTWIDNVTYTSSNNTATHTIIGGNANGCDSIVTLNLTINQPTTGIDVQTACKSYTWIDNITYTASNNTATHTIVGGNANGCDSIVTLDLTINTVDVTVTDNSPTLIANNTSATSYQWINCTTDLQLNGETNATYDADLNGNYAVIVTENGCTDTSSCIIVSNVSLDDINEGEELIKIYPNPSTGKVYLEFDQPNTTEELSIVDITGKQVMKLQPNDPKIEINLDLKPGSYFIHYKEGVYRFVIN